MKKDEYAALLVVLVFTIWVALLGLGLSIASAVQAAPGYGNDCILPSVSECRLMPDADGPHTVDRWCAGVGWVSVFTPCLSEFGPYSR